MDDNVSTPLPTHAVNSTTSDMAQLKMLRVMKELQKYVNNMKSAGVGSGNSNEKKKRVQKKTSKLDCSWKKPGYLDNAIATAKKDDSSEYYN